MTVAFDLLSAGNLFGAFLAAYENAGVPAAFLYLMIVSLSCILLYIKTESPTMIGLVLILTGSIIMPFVDPIMMKYYFAVILVGVGIAIYGVFQDK